MIPPVSSSALCSPRPACPRCQRPLRACLCRWITPTANRVAVLILQHPQEQHHAKGSLRLLRLSLAHCRVEVSASFEADSLRSWLEAPWPESGSGPPICLLLYPVAAREMPPPSGPPMAATLSPHGGQRLVLLDGTWRQTRQMLREHPKLQQLPRCALPAPSPSRYTIRKAQRPDQRSTLEAACLALGSLEGRPAAYAPLLSAFDGWVAQSLGLYAAADDARV